jgi:hypothetical protein
MKPRRKIATVVARKRPANNCPVAKLACEFDRLAAEYSALEKQGCDRERMTVWHRMNALHVIASYQQPKSDAGAAFQIALASAGIDILCSSKMNEPQAEELQEQIERLLHAAFRFVAGGTASHSFLIVDPIARCGLMRQMPVAGDPIFAAIEEWKASEAATYQFEESKEYKSPAGRRAWGRYDKAQHNFCACVPTTSAGLAAALAFARDKAKEREETNFLEDFHKLAPMFAASMATAAARIAQGGAA